MKVATIIYHSNIKSIYKKEWISDCINSIKNQTFSDFTVYELNYGDDDSNFGDEYDIKQEHHFYKKKFNNHGEAMNFLFDECLLDDCDIVLNNNMDDFSDLNRFEIQISKILDGYDIVSSNFVFVDDNGKTGKEMRLSHLNPIIEFNNDHNIICHPSVCYSRNFLEKNRYDGNEIPREDFLLWKRTINDYKFFICSELLINYRFHINQITSQHKFREREEEFIKETNRLMEKFNLPNIYIDESPNVNPINELPREAITIRKSGTLTHFCECGEPKNKVKYNYCQKCNKLY